jgi:hypothetical protein
LNFVPPASIPPNTVDVNLLASSRLDNGRFNL